MPSENDPIFPFITAHFDNEKQVRLPLFIRQSSNQAEQTILNLYEESPNQSINQAKADHANISPVHNHDSSSPTPWIERDRLDERGWKTKELPAVLLLPG